MKSLVRLVLLMAIASQLTGTPAFTQGRNAASPAAMLLKPARVFDGDAIHDGWVVLVRGERIEAAGPSATISAPLHDGHRPDSAVVVWVEPQLPQRTENGGMCVSGGWDSPA